VLAITPLVSPLHGILSRLVDRLRRRGRVIDLFETFPELDHLPFFRYPAYTNMFATIEEWMGEHFGFATMNGVLPEYAQAYRHVTFGHIERMSTPVMVIETLSGLVPDAEIRGGDTAFAGMYHAWTGKALPFRHRPTRVGRRIINWALAGAVTAAGMIFVLARLRPGLAPPEPRLLGATFVLDQRHYPMLREIVDADEQVTSIFLTRNDVKEHQQDPDGFGSCSVFSGRFDVQTAIGIVVDLSQGLVRLARRLGHLDPVHFRAMARLPIVRVRYRGLLRRYGFKFIFGRDDYNAEHIMRTRELRRTGGVSMGINHGLPTTNLIEPGWRYLDFDIYYVFGRHLYDRYYRGILGANMTVTPVGTFGVNRAQLRKITQRRTRDIVYFVNPGPFEEAQSRTMRDVAKAFPDRTIWIKIKSSRKLQGYCEATLNLLDGYATNLVETEENSYELLLRHGYAVCGLSTIAAEAIQLGVKTFVLDVQPAHMPNLYRDFPGLCAGSGEEVASRIQAMESGVESFVRDQFADLIALDTNIFDTIRADIGLPPRSDTLAA
jgi:hypothetical protein